MSAFIIAYRNEAGEDRRISLDIETEISYEGKSEVSAFPLESGAVVSDHKTNKPIVINVTGKVSRHPIPGYDDADAYGSFSNKDLTYPTQDRAATNYPPIKYPPPQPTAAIGNPGSLLAGLKQPQPVRQNRDTSPNLPTSAHGFWVTDFASRSKKILDELEEIRIKAFPCDVIFELDTATDMQLTSVVATRSKEQGTTSVFALTFEAIKRTTLRKADVPIPSELLAKPKKSLGSQSQKEDDPTKEAQKKSWLKQIANGGVKKLFGLDQ